MKNLLKLLIVLGFSMCALLAGVAITGQPPYRINDNSGVQKNFEEIYFLMETHRHNDPDSASPNDFVPELGSVYGLGSSLKTWATGYIDSIVFADGSRQTTAAAGVPGGEVLITFVDNGAKVSISSLNVLSAQFTRTTSGSSATYTLNPASVTLMGPFAKIRLDALDLSTASLKNQQDGFSVFRATAESYISGFVVFRSTAEQKIDALYLSTQSLSNTGFILFRSTAEPILDGLGSSTQSIQSQVSAVIASTLTYPTSFIQNQSNAIQVASFSVLSGSLSVVYPMQIVWPDGTIQVSSPQAGGGGSGDATVSQINSTYSYAVSQFSAVFSSVSALSSSTNSLALNFSNTNYIQNQNLNVQNASFSILSGKYYVGYSTFIYNSSNVYTHAISGDASDGLYLQANNLTKVGLLGSANTANASWYGVHNFDGGSINVNNGHALNIGGVNISTAVNGLVIFKSTAEPILDGLNLSTQSIYVSISVFKSTAEHILDGLGTSTQSIQSQVDEIIASTLTYPTSFIQNQSSSIQIASFSVLSGSLSVVYPLQIVWPDGTIQVSSPQAGGGGSGDATVSQVNSTYSYAVSQFSAAFSSLSALSVSTNSLALNFSNTNYIQNINTPQAGETFFVSSGSAINFYQDGHRVLDQSSTGQFATLQYVADATSSIVFNGATVDQVNSTYTWAVGQFNSALSSITSLGSSTQALAGRLSGLEVFRSTAEVRLDAVSLSTSALGLTASNTNYINLTGSTQTKSGGLNVLASVGVGTGTPSVPLHVKAGNSPGGGFHGYTILGIEGDTLGGLSIKTPNTATGIVYFADPEDGGAGNIRYNHSNNAMSLRTNSVTTDRVLISSEGNVGIGTSSPVDRLHVFSAEGPSSEGAGVMMSGGASGNTRIELRGGNPYIDLSNDTSSDYDARIILSGNDYVFLDGANLGINDNAPLSKLSINGGSILDGNVPAQMSAGGSLAYWGVNRTNGNYGALFGWDTTYGGVTLRSVSSADDISLVTNNNLRALNLKPSGRVGIGTTNPTNLFTVHNGSAAISGTNANLTVANNVSIGTTETSFNLTVQHPSGNSASAVIASTGITKSAVLGMIAGNKIYEIYAEGNQGSTNPGGLYVNDTSSGTTPFSITTTGNVGIGTLRPSSKFFVDGGSVVVRGGGSAMQVTGGESFANGMNQRPSLTLGSSTGTLSGALKMHSYDANLYSLLHVTNGNLHIDAAEPGFGIYLNYYGGTGGTFFGSGANSAPSNIDSSGNLNAGSNRFAASGDSYIATGNVGIGTTSPVAKLHVQQNAGSNTPALNVSTGSTKILEVTGSSFTVRVATVSIFSSSSTLNFGTVYTSPTDAFIIAGSTATDGGSCYIQVDVYRGGNANTPGDWLAGNEARFRDGVAKSLRASVSFVVMAGEKFQATSTTYNSCSGLTNKITYTPLGDKRP